MKEKRYLILLFLTCFSITAQIKGIVVDDKNQPISYVNIWIENENIGTTSEKNGEFLIDTTNEKFLVFSAVGFEIKKTKILDNEKVVLETAIYALDDIVIDNRKESKELEIGDSKNTQISHLSGALPWIYAKRFNFVEEYKKTPYIKSVIVFTKSKIKNAKFKLRIFKVNENGFPGVGLLDEDLIVNVKSGFKKNVIDLTKYHLSFPKDGIFIAYEWMIIDENKYIYEFTTKESLTKKSSINYAPAVICNEVETDNTFEYREAKWIQRKRFLIRDKSKESVLEPAINLILTD